jgi:hypothetical protein
MFKALINTMLAFNHYKDKMAQFTNIYASAITDAVCIYILFICGLFNNYVSS